MPKQVSALSNIEIDEISLVDRGANQHAKVAIAKRATEEVVVPEFFNENGELVDLDTLEFGSVVYDVDGNAFQMVEDSEEIADAQEMAEVGKSLADRVREDLSKALTDIDRDDVIAKAADEISKAQARAEEAEMIAKSERDLRLDREYIAKAYDYNVGVAPETLGPVLKRMAESMSYEDCAVIAKALESASDVAFQEIGYAGMADNNDVMRQVDALVGESVAKSAEISKAAATAHVFETNPAAYDEYLRSRN